MAINSTKLQLYKDVWLVLLKILPNKLSIFILETIELSDGLKFACVVLPKGAFSPDRCGDCVISYRFAIKLREIVKGFLIEQGGFKTWTTNRIRY